MIMNIWDLHTYYRAITTRNFIIFFTSYALQTFIFNSNYQKLKTE